MKILTDTAQRISTFLTGIDRPTANRKTGHMAQVWVLDSDIEPRHQTRGGYKACGDCRLNDKHEGGKTECYVVFAQGPQKVWKTYNHKPTAALPEPVDYSVRIGSAGDGALISGHFLKRLIARFKGWTAYTHQWDANAKQRGRAGFLSQYFMASIDPKTAYSKGHTANEWRQQAKALGYRTFRVTATPEPDEVLCPNVSHGIQCADCLLCSGTEGRGNCDIYIPPHGSGSKLIDIALPTTSAPYYEALQVEEENPFLILDDPSGYYHTNH